MVDCRTRQGTDHPSHLRPRNAGGRTLAFLVAFIFALGCSDGALDGAKGSLRPSTHELDFPRTYIGHPTEAELRLVNTGRAALHFEIRLEGAFSTPVASGRVAGGSEQVLRVRFDPRQPGPYSETLEVFFEDERVAVALLGEAVAPPPCRGSGPCRSVTFDPVRERCVEEWFEDGAPCESGNACMVEERCLGGSCIGTARSCDDGDLCSVKACDPDLGCVAQPIHCPEPEEPCRVAICDPKTGCGSAVAPDGTPCGPADCSGAHVCWNGTCREAPVPDGFPCTTDCGSGGCKGGKCHREEGDVLTLAWSLSVDGVEALTFPGLVDDFGNLYWFEMPECNDEADGDANCLVGSFLVSATPDGFERYRIFVSGFVSGGSDAFERIAWVGGDLWVANHGSLRAYATLDGELRWAIDLRDLGFEEHASIRLRGLVRTTDGALAHLEVDEDPRFVVLSAGGGLEASWGFAAGETPSLPIADAAGHLYVSVESGAKREVVAFGTSGDELWRRPSLGGGVPLAVSSGVLLVGGEGALHAYRSSDGDHLGGWDVAPEAVVLSLQRGYLLELGASGGLIALNPNDRTLAPVPLGASELLVGEPSLSNEQKALFLAAGEVGDMEGWFFAEAGPAGDPRLCLMPGLDAPHRRWTLAMGRLCVATETAVLCYELPKADLAVEGWITPWGSPYGGRAGR